MSKLTVAKVVAKLSLLGYELVSSDYKLERVYKGEILNCKIAYFLKDTKHKTGQVTFTDGRKSFKNGLALDITITDEKDLYRPIKVYQDKTYVKLLRIDYEQEKQNEIKLLKEENIKNKDIAKQLQGLDRKLVSLTILCDKIDLLNTNISQMKESQIEYTQKIINSFYPHIIVLIFILILLSWKLF